MSNLETRNPSTASTTVQKDVGSIDFLDLLLSLVRDRLLIVLATVIAFVAGIAFALTIPPTFTATATLLIPQQQSASSALLGQLGSLAALSGGGLKNPGDMYVGILQSRTIADRLIGRFRLQQEYHTKLEETTRATLASHAKFVNGKDGIIEISVSDGSATRASELANGYVEELHQVNSTLAITEAAQRRDFFDKQLEVEKKALSLAEDDLRSTQKKTGLIQLSGQAEIIIRSVAQVRAEIASREVQLQALSAYETDQNRQITTLQNEIATLRRQLAGLESDQGRIEAGNTQIPTGRMPEAGLEYLRRLREIKYHETLLELLSRQYESARLDEARAAPILQVIDRAMPPNMKSGPHRTLIALGAGIFGFFAACGISLIRHGLKRITQTPEHAARLYELRSMFTRAR